ncbi:MAG: caspase family protein, partial [Planctomycetia bacterium]|nr:caspase family protein [Planctomycetia bacterium]
MKKPFVLWNWMFLCLLLYGMCAAAENERGIAVVPKAEDDGAEKYAFIVAVNNYDELNDLHCTVSDAYGLKEQLLKLGFEEENIIILTTEENVVNRPTKKKILSCYEDLLGCVEEGDWVVVYLSGHGVQIPGKEGSWFCPREAKRENLEETTVSIDDMLKKLSETNAGFRWMIV